MATNLKSAKLLFEPAPPLPQPVSSSAKYSQGASVVKRRVQSAKEGRWKYPQLREQDGLKKRPNSAVPSSERTVPGGLARKPPSGRNVRPLVGQNLNFNPASTNYSPLDDRSVNTDHLEEHLREGRRTIKSEIAPCHPSPTTSVGDVEIPSGISALAPWLTPSIDQRLIGVDPSSCLVFLPSLTDCDDLPVVPPLQSARDPLPYTAVKPREKSFDPKKLFHYDVLKNRPHSADHICDHRRKEVSTDAHIIYGSDGRMLYDGRNYHRNRTKEMIQKEIEDLENLLQGIGTEDSANMLARYQYDINVLHRAATETLTEHSAANQRLLEVVSPPPQDLTGLRAFLKQREKMIQRIKRRREKCIRELEYFDQEFGMRVNIVIPS